MFTGLIDSKGIIKSKIMTSDGARFGISCDYKDLELGESISINGACHTVVNILTNGFEVDTMNETLNHTNLGKLSLNNVVNLERAMKADSRFGGHIVTGHIDGCAKLLSKKQDGISNVYRFEYSDRYIVQKGSICINGVSLTVSDTGKNYFEVSLIPHTLKSTNLLDLNVGDYVNIENDILAKYIEKYCGNKKEIDENFLERCGF